jgi:hypothetical protein
MKATILWFAYNLMVFGWTNHLVGKVFTRTDYIVLCATHLFAWGIGYYARYLYKK